MPQLYMIVPVGLDGAVDPGYGHPGGGPRPGHDLPWAPAFPGHDLPGGGLHPGNRPPGSWGGPTDPGFGVGRPDRPDAGLPPFVPVRVDNTLPEIPGVPQTHKPVAPGEIWPPLPPGLPKGKVAILVWISGVGHRYAIIDTSLSPDAGLPPSPGHPDAGLPPTAAPKY